MPQSPPFDDSFAPPGLYCGPISPDSPHYHDCDEAYQRIESRPPQLICGLGPPQYQHDVITVGTCTVHTYSQKGNAHCLDRNHILTGIENIMHACLTDDDYTQGYYTWTKEGQKREGVKLIWPGFVW